MFQNAMINEDGFLIDEIGSAEIYTVYICWGVDRQVLPVIMSNVYIYRYMCRIHKMCVCVCVERQLSTKGMHMYIIVNFFKMEKKSLFDVRDYEKLWIASITFFFQYFLSFIK